MFINIAQGMLHAVLFFVYIYVWFENIEKAKCQNDRPVLGIA
jgi:hypothetical protein